MTKYATLFSILLGSAAAIFIVPYSDDNCQTYTNEDGSGRNIYDNTCATGIGGYCSFKVTAYGASGQLFSPYSRDACAGDTFGYSCGADGADYLETSSGLTVKGCVLQQCVTVHDDAGCANAGGSLTVP